MDRHISLCSLNIRFFIYSLAFFTIYRYTTKVLTMWPAPSWLDSSVSWALHWYRRDHGFQSWLQAWIFFQALIYKIISWRFTAHVHHFLEFYMLMYLCLLLFVGTDCKTETVGIRIRKLTFKQPFANRLSIEFKSLESSLLSAVSCFNYAVNDWDQIYMPYTLDLRVKLNQDRDIKGSYYMASVCSRYNARSDWLNAA